MSGLAETADAGGSFVVIVVVVGRRAGPTTLR